MATDSDSRDRADFCRATDLAAATGGVSKGHLTAGSIRADLLGARATLLTGNPQSAVFVIAGDGASGKEDAEHRIQVYPTNFEPLAPFARQAASR